MLFTASWHSARLEIVSQRWRFMQTCFRKCGRMVSRCPFFFLPLADLFFILGLLRALRVVWKVERSAFQLRGEVEGVGWTVLHCNRG